MTDIMNAHVKSAKEQAEAELLEETKKKAVVAIKQKMRELKAAEQVVANIQRELEDLYVSIGDGTHHPKP